MDKNYADHGIPLERPQTAQVLDKIGGASNPAAIGEDYDANEIMDCPNCQQEMPASEIAAHTVQCYRNQTKCKACGEILLKENRKEHLNQWRDLDLMQTAIKNDNEE